MPGIVVPRRRRVAELDDEEDSDDREVTPLSQQSSGSKRRRSESESSEDELPRATKQRQTRPMNAPNGATPNGISQEGHAPGAIIRIKVTNFVTYTSAVFHCGPSLNMVIGPNGTGKSTLVCAICLGLGWSPSCLGRAKEIGEFVKYGQREASIEIELAAGPAQRGKNPLIRRLIKKEGNKSAWWINGRTANHKDVTALARSFRIQIDNLCQFLPQDRVVEFAAMNPVQLLESTQKAAASEEMSEWYERLKDLADQRKQMVNEQRDSQAALTEHQTRHNQQRAEVERMNERRELSEQLAGLKKARVVIRYKTEKAKRDETKARLEAAKSELATLREELEPSLGRVRHKEVYCAKVKGLVESRKKTLEVTTRKAADSGDRHKGYESRFKELNQQYDAEGTGRKKLRDDVKRQEAAIRNYESRLQGRPPEIDLEDYKRRLAEVDAQKRSQTARAMELKDLLMRYKEQLQERERQREANKRELEQLNTHAGQQIRKLQRSSQDTFNALQWVRKNKHLFEDSIYEPPIISCSVRDTAYVDAVETLLQAGDFLAFTTTNTRDYRKLFAHLTTKKGQPVRIRREPGGLFPDGYDPGVEGEGLGQIYIRNAKQTLDYWKPTVSQERLADYQLDGWAIDLLQGPEPVLSMLCAEKLLHKTAVGRARHTPQQFDRLKHPNSGINKWVAGQDVYMVTRRAEYGPGAESTQVQPVTKAQFWSDQSGDSSLSAELSKQINILSGELAELQQQREQAADEFEEMKERNEEFARQKAVIEQEKREMQKAQGEWEVIPSKIERHRTNIDRLQSDIVKSDKRRYKLRDQQGQMALERAQNAIAYSKIIVALRKCHADLIDAEIWAIEAESEVDGLKGQNQQAQQAIETREAEVQQLTQEDAEQMQRGRELAKEVQRMTDAATEEELLVVRELSDSGKGLDELEADILTMTGRIELLHEGDPQAIQQFEARQRKIEQLEERLRNFEGDLQRRDTQITQTRERWEPRLDELVGKISDAFAHNFEQIGCAGQVGIHKDEEDFGQWAIRIEVKFRENEQLALLDSHRQSGGERAVSTIFYLMALQSLAQAPFRVVDEINQGMDPRNERMVHERMVDIACSENTSQYFLITPKLLNGLKYHERMAVHTIYSGETMPEDNSSLDFRQLAKIALRVAGKVH